MKEKKGRSLKDNGKGKENIKRDTIRKKNEVGN